MLLLLFLTVFTVSASGQTSRMDSMQWANDSLDSRLHSIIEKYEEQRIDFVILRVYDSLLPISSRCRILYREDSCTQMYSLDVHTDYNVHYIHVGRIQQRRSNQCFDEIGDIRKGLTLDTDFFTSIPPSALHFPENMYTLYGKIDGEYLYETFESDFVTEHHPGILYHVVCTYLDGRCVR